METRRNTPLVLAKFLRHAVLKLRVHSIADDGPNDRQERENALDSIDAVADALEDKAAAPDPAGATS